MWLQDRPQCIDVFMQWLRLVHGSVYDHMSCGQGAAPLPRLCPFRCECVGWTPITEEISSMFGIVPEIRREAECAKYVSSSRSVPARKPRVVSIVTFLPACR